MHGLVAQMASAATAGIENPFTTIADPDITTQNNQFIFTGPYSLLGDMLIGASVQFGRYNVAQWNGRGRPTIFGVNRFGNPTAPIWWGYYNTAPIALPQNQQIQVLATNNLASGTENEYCLWKICTQDWRANFPPGQYDFIARATATITPIIGAWAPNNPITFDVLPLGGVYAVLGCRCVGLNGIAFRLNFPRTRMYLGRRLRPGDVILNNFGQMPPQFMDSEFSDDGVWGYFHTFEVPMLDILGTLNSATVFTLFMKLRYIGEPVSLLDQAVLGNY